MSTFITRVELHGATYEDYGELHGHMALEGYSTTIRADDGTSYHLPPAEYQLTADCTIEDARTSAARAAQKTRKAFAILTSEYTRAAWIGLQPVRVRARA